MDKITVVVPVYNEQEAIPYFYDELKKLSSEMNEVIIELLFVDDGSSDDTINVIKNLKNKDKNINFISFSRNFGKEAAMYAGLKNADGDYVAVIDVDLQDPPYLLKEMYFSIKNEGYDCVASRRTDRKGESKIRSFFAKMFYNIINRISKTEIVDGARDFRLMAKQMVKAILEVCEYNRFSKGIFCWVGFKTKWIEFKNTERVAGSTKWSFFKLFLYSLEGIVAFTTAPLAIASVTGILFCFLSAVLIVTVIIRQLLWGGSAYGWTSMICIILFLSGIQLFCMGVLGQYLAKTYLETKKRPIYIEKENSKTDI